MNADGTVGEPPRHWLDGDDDFSSADNPVGRCYDRDALLVYGRFAEEHDLHLVFDEVRLRCHSGPSSEELARCSRLEFP